MELIGREQELREVIGRLADRRLVTLIGPAGIGKTALAFAVSAQVAPRYEPTMVVAGEIDIVTPPRYGQVVAEGIPGATFVVLPGEAHQPFQESPEAFNAMVDAFWSSLEPRQGGR